MAVSKSDLFPVGVDLHCCCPLLPVLYRFYIKRISRCSLVEEGGVVFFGDLRITSLLYVDDVLLATWSMDLQFAARCEVAGMSTP